MTEVRFLRARGYKCGQVVDLPVRQAQVLVENGDAEYVVAPAKLKKQTKKKKWARKKVVTPELTTTEPLITDQDAE